MDSLCQTFFPASLKQRQYFLYWRKRTTRRKEDDRSQTRSSVTHRLREILVSLVRLFSGANHSKRSGETEQDEIEEGWTVEMILGIQYAAIALNILTNIEASPFSQYLPPNPVMNICVLIIHEALELVLL